MTGSNRLAWPPPVSSARRVRQSSRSARRRVEQVQVPGAIERQSAAAQVVEKRPRRHLQFGDDLQPVGSQLRPKHVANPQRDHGVGGGVRDLLVAQVVAPRCRTAGRRPCRPAGHRDTARRPTPTRGTSRTRSGRRTGGRQPAGHPTTGRRRHGLHRQERNSPGPAPRRRRRRSNRPPSPRPTAAPGHARQVPHVRPPRRSRRHHRLIASETTRSAPGP